MPTLDLNDAEFQALAGFLDAGTKYLGIRALKDGAALLVKMDAAVQQLKPAPDALVTSVEDKA